MFFRIQLLRHIKDFFGIMFKLDTEQILNSEDGGEQALGGDKVLLTCVGVGFRNISKVIL